MFSLHDMTSAITNNAIAMSNDARFITSYHLSRDLGGKSHVLGDGSVTLRGVSDAWGGWSKLKGAGSQIRRDPAYFNPWVWVTCYNLVHGSAVQSGDILQLQQRCKIRQEAKVTWRRLHRRCRGIRNPVYRNVSWAPKSAHSKPNISNSSLHISSCIR